MENEKLVLQALEKDARLSAAQVADMTGVPVAEVQKIIKKAEKEGDHCQI